MRKTVTSFQLGQTTRTVTEIKNTLNAVEADTFVLTREVTVITGARGVAKKPESIRYNFFNMVEDSTTQEKELDSENILVGINAVPCQVREFQKVGSLRRESTKVWYSSVLFPYIFQQITKTYTLPNAETPEETLFRQSVTNIFFQTPDFRFNNIKRWGTKTMETDGDGNVVKRVTTIHFNQVPGGVISESVVEFSPEGRVIGRSETRLLDYYVAPR